MERENRLYSAGTVIILRGCGLRARRVSSVCPMFIVWWISLENRRKSIRSQPASCLAYPIDHVRMDRLYSGLQYQMRYQWLGNDWFEAIAQTKLLARTKIFLLPTRQFMTVHEEKQSSITERRFTRGLMKQVEENQMTIVHDLDQVKGTKGGKEEVHLTRVFFAGVFSTRFFAILIMASFSTALPSVFTLASSSAWSASSSSVSSSVKPLDFFSFFMSIIA